MRGGLDSTGKVTAFDYYWKGVSGQEVGTSGEGAGDTLDGMSLRVHPGAEEHLGRSVRPLRVREQARPR